MFILTELPTNQVISVVKALVQEATTAVSGCRCVATRPQVHSKSEIPCVCVCREEDAAGPELPWTVDLLYPQLTFDICNGLCSVRLMFVLDAWWQQHGNNKLGLNTAFNMWFLLSLLCFTSHVWFSCFCCFLFTKLFHLR